MCTLYGRDDISGDTHLEEGFCTSRKVAGTLGCASLVDKDNNRRTRRAIGLQPRMELQSTLYVGI